MWPHRDQGAGKRRLAIGDHGARRHRLRPGQYRTRDGGTADLDSVPCGGAGRGRPGERGRRAGYGQSGTGRHDDDRSGAANRRFTRFGEIAERTDATIGGLPATWFGLWDSEAHLLGLDREGVTVFAPTNAAYEALDPAILAVIDDPNVANDLLRTLLGAHYIPNPYPTAAFEPGPHPVHRGTAAPVELSVDPLAWGGHAIEQADLRTANGYIHAIDGVVIPDDITAAARKD